MKFKVGDQVIVTGGKDKAKKSQITQVLAGGKLVVVAGINMYVKHVKPYGDRPGERIKKERPLNVANVAVLNDKGKPDRIGYKVLKDGTKQRIFRKTGSVAETAKKEIKK